MTEVIETSEQPESVKWRVEDMAPLEITDEDREWPYPFPADEWEEEEF